MPPAPDSLSVYKVAPELDLAVPNTVLSTSVVPPALLSAPRTVVAAFKVRFVAAVANGVPAVPMAPVVETIATFAPLTVTPAAVCIDVAAVLTD